MITLIAIAGFTRIIYQKNWERVKRVCKKLRMTVKMWITSISPEFNFKTRKKCDTRRKYNNKKRFRRYISAKRKGKTTKIEKKSKIRYTFLQAKPALYVCSKIATDFPIQKQSLYISSCFVSYLISPSSVTLNEFPFSFHPRVCNC